MSDDTQIAKIGNNLPQPGRPQQPIQANLNQYGNDSTQIAYETYEGLRWGGFLHTACREIWRDKELL